MIPREPEIALVFAPEPWVEELHRHFTDHGGVRVRQLIVDPVLAREESYDTLVSGSSWPALTVGLVEDLHERGRRILGVHDRGDEAALTHLTSIGVDRCIESDAAPEEFEAVLIAMAPRFVRADPEVPERWQTTAGHSATGRIIVGGPGGTGATEVAIHLAAACVAAGEPVVLVDGDDVAPSVAQRLALPIEPNLRTAVDAVQHGLGDVESCLMPIGRSGVQACCGLPNAAAWSQLRPNEVLDVLRRLEDADRRLVVDVGHRLEDLGSGRRTRYSLARALVAAGDVLVGVTSGSPVGLTRGLGWIADVRALQPAAPLHLVVNRAPREPFKRSELRREILRTHSPATITIIPFDRRVGAVSWSGGLVARGSFRRAVDSLANRLTCHGVSVDGDTDSDGEHVSISHGVGSVS